MFDEDVDWGKVKLTTHNEGTDKVCTLIIQENTIFHDDAKQYKEVMGMYDIGREFAKKVSGKEFNLDKELDYVKERVMTKGYYEDTVIDKQTHSLMFDEVAHLLIKKRGLNGKA